MCRLEDFNKIVSSFGIESKSGDNYLIINDDAINALKKIPDHTISLILTDPPYHSTKKENIINDKAFSTDEDFISWMDAFAKEWKRILRANGSIFMFCSSNMEAKLEIMLSNYFNILSHIVWTKPNEPGYDGWKGKMKKESLRQWYPQSERIIFMEAAEEGNLKRSCFGNLLRERRLQCGLSGHLLTEMIGAYGKVNHGGAVSNWESGRNIPSRKQYHDICNALKKSGLNTEMPLYEDVIRPFEVNSEMEFTDVWNFPSVKAYKGKHPAEKPLDMLIQCIRSTTFENDIVLDCFAGSGSTLIAAILTKRYAVGIEIDKKWYNSIIERLESEVINPSNLGKCNIMKESAKPIEKTPDLFD